jgi:hypothetical protein
MTKLPWSRRTLPVVALALLAPLAAYAQAEAEVTPQRPSLSFNANTVRARAWEVETGADVSETSAGIPLLVKYGLVDRAELEIGANLVRTVSTDETVATSHGDLVLGVRAGTPPNPEWAVAGGVAWVKVPTADDDVGSGEFDAGLIGILSIPIGSLSLDTNLWVSALGQGGDSFRGQVQGIVTLSFPLPGAWSAYGEVAWQSTAAEGSGGFFDAGATYAVTPRTAIDAAAGVGWSDGYPDWSVTVGWTVLARAGRR